MIVVIGSGPAGVACAKALLLRGQRVTMLDAGIELEEDKTAILSKLRATWDDEAVKKLKTKLDPRHLTKLTYGSSYPYEGVSDFFPLITDPAIHCSPSFARGGLSNVWGAFVEQYTADQLQDWPIDFQQLAKYYPPVLQMLSVSSLHEKNHYQSSAQAKQLWSHLTTHKNRLNEQGLEFGASELAVQFVNSNGSTECRYCGSCLYGCPLELIYSASHSLNELLKNANFTYIKNIVVESFHETERYIEIYAAQRLTQEKIVFKASQVFSGCGAIISTALLLRSMKQDAKKVQFIDSTHFIIPCIMKDRIKQVAMEKLHTLCQLYLKLNHSLISKKPIHLQVYTYMEHYLDFMKAKFGFFTPLFTPLLDRLIMIQGYLDSSESHRFTLQVDQNRIQLTALSNATVAPTLKKLMQLLQKNNAYLGFYPLRFMMRLSKISRSFHYGGSLPMKQHPNEFETDSFGKPTGFSRLHIIDAAIFPSIPAGSITPTIMANAYRIASECALYEAI